MEYANPNLSIRQKVCAALPPLPDKDPRQTSPLVLAYIGDTLYDLYVRSYCLRKSDAGAHGLHMQAAGMVCASAQAQAFRLVEDMLDEEELSVFKRGRNAHMGTVPKHATIADYRTATGFEALLGYLYLYDRDVRITQIMQRVMAANEN